MPRKEKPIEHGTASGYTKHVKNPGKYGEPCAPCKAANAEYMDQYRQTNGRDRATENYQRRIKSRAMARLADNHKKELDALIVAVEQELKESAS